MKGQINSFNSTKGYGFITGDNDNRYFFHITEWLYNENPSEKMTVSFTPVREKKGLRANQVKPVLGKTNTENPKEKPSTFFRPYDKFLFTHDSKPENFDVYFESDWIFIDGSKSYGTLKAEMKDIAMKVGANAILSLKEEKNYSHHGNKVTTSNQVTGKLAIVGRHDGHKNDQEQLNERARRIKKYTENFYEVLRKIKRQETIFKTIILSTIIGIVLWVSVTG